MDSTNSCICVAFSDGSIMVDWNCSLVNYMCLTIKDRQIHTAEKDTVVYKLLELSEGTFKSPYFPVKWFVGETKKIDCFNSVRHGSDITNLVEEFFIDEIPQHVEIIEQGFHSYTTLGAANQWRPKLEEANSLRWRKVSTITCRMTIPKGSKYVIGTDNEIVSNCLKFDKIVDERVHTGRLTMFRVDI